MDIFEIEELSAQKIEQATELLENGNGISYHNLGIFFLQHNMALVFIQSKYEADNITKSLVFEEIDKAKLNIHEILRTNNTLSNILQKRKLRYVLYNDYGTSSMRICEEIDGNFKWIHRSKN